MLSCCVKRPLLTVLQRLHHLFPGAHGRPENAVELLQKERQMPEVVDRWLVKYHRLCGHLPTVLFSDGAPVNASAGLLLLLNLL